MNADEPAGAVGPYKGLAPFGDSELDALLFFGREREREIVAANLIAARLTVLYGPSGVGKSSLLRAAVARSLRELPEQPVVAVFASWAENPSAGLTGAVAEAAAIPAADSLRETLEAVGERDVYLILDQAEEYFLYHGEGEPAFEDDLVRMVTEPLRVNVLLSLREDALAKLDRFKGRIPNLFGNYLRLDRLDRAAGGAAIVRPVERWNELQGTTVTVQPALVETVLDGVGTGRIEPSVGGVGADTNGRPAGIEAPYLQLVMQRIWEVERETGSLELREETLEELGGAEHVVAEHLERALDELQPFQKDIAADLSRYLVTPSGTKISHTLADLAIYAGREEAGLQPVAAALSERRILRSLESDGELRYEIFHDVLAGAVLAWRTRYQASRQLERERRTSRRRHRRLITLTTVALLAAAGMGALTLWALSERRDAHAQAILVHARELDATALGRMPNDPELSLLLARQAARIAPSPQVEQVLRDALQTSHVRWVARPGGAVVAASFDPTGRITLVATESGKVRLYESGRLLRTLDHRASITTAGFDRSGDHVVTAGADGVADVWALDGSIVRRVRHGAAITAAAFSTDGALLVTAGGHAAKVWRVNRGGLVAELRTPHPVRDALFSPDGRLVVVWGRDRMVRVFSLATRRVKWSFDQEGRVTDAAISPDGRTVVTAGANKLAFLWSLHSGRKLATLSGHVGQVWKAVFGPRSDTVGTASLDGTGRIWTLRPGGALAGVIQLPGHTNPVVDVAFSPDGRFVVTTSKDDTARVATVDKGAFRAVLAGDTDTVRLAAFSPDGARIITASDDGTARVWDAGTVPELAPTYRSEPPAPVTEAVSRDGTRAIVTGKNVELRGPRGSYVLRGHRKPVDAVAFSPDGTQLATASADTDARVWDVGSGRLLHRLHAHFGPVSDVRFSPDGRWIVTAGPTTAGLWVASTGDFDGYLRGPKTLLTRAAFGKDSRTIITSERDGTVRSWVCDICGTLDELLVVADARLAATGRTLTAEERKRYAV